MLVSGEHEREVVLVSGRLGRELCYCRESLREVVLVSGNPKMKSCASVGKLCLCRHKMACCARVCCAVVVCATVILPESLVYGISKTRLQYQDGDEIVFQEEFLPTPRTMPTRGGREKKVRYFRCEARNYCSCMDTPLNQVAHHRLLLVFSVISLF